MTLDQSRGPQARAEALKVQIHEDTTGPVAENQLAHGLILISKRMQPWELCKTSSRSNKESRNYLMYVNHNIYSKLGRNADLQTNVSRARCRAF